jgi:hypothetical protein
VLLFPGDARLTRQDLLARTVFCKVPDHGSQAALDPAAVDAMTHPDLVVAITANAEFAASRGLELPAAAVQARLVERTHGRLLAPGPDRLMSMATANSPSNRTFRNRTSVTELYVDYLLP